MDCEKASQFAWWKTTARWALGAMLATMPTAMVIFYFTGNVHLFGFAYIIFWLPLAIIIWKKDFSDGIIPVKGFYHTVPLGLHHQMHIYPQPQHQK